MLLGNLGYSNQMECSKSSKYWHWNQLLELPWLVWCNNLKIRYWSIDWKNADYNFFYSTQYSFLQCYVSHSNLAVHVTAQNSNLSQTVLINVTECQGYSHWLLSLLPNYSGKCNTANDCKLAVNICSVVHESYIAPGAGINTSHLMYIQ